MEIQLSCVLHVVLLGLVSGSSSGKSNSFVVGYMKPHRVNTIISRTLKKCPTGGER